jgi:membrane protein YqaA with SNARE-associated domain
MSAVAAYAGMFLSAFLAATILPVNSEIVFVGLLLADHSPLFVVIVASAGNVLGTAVNWLLGRGVERYHDRRWFPVSSPTLLRAQRWYRRYGRWSLLLSWTPILGDALTVAAGALREPFVTFLLLVTVAKAGRYAVLAATVTSVL